MGKIMLNGQTLIESGESGNALTYNPDTDYFGAMYNGEWKDVVYAGFQAKYLYKLGQFPLKDIVGDLTRYNIKVSYGSGAYGAYPIVTYNAESIKLECDGDGNYSGLVAFPKAIDVTLYDYLKINVLSTSGYPTLALHTSIAGDTLGKDPSGNNLNICAYINPGVYQIDLRNVTGVFYVMITNIWATTEIVFDKIWFE